MLKTVVDDQQGQGLQDNQAASMMSYYNSRERARPCEENKVFVLTYINLEIKSFTSIQKKYKNLKTILHKMKNRINYFKIRIYLGYKYQF